MAINYRKNDLEQQMLLNLHKRRCPPTKKKREKKRKKEKEREKQRLRERGAKEIALQWSSVLSALSKKKKKKKRKKKKKKKKKG